MHENDNELTVQFVKRQPGSSHLFTFPHPGDIDTVDNDDIVQIIAEPRMNTRNQYCITHELL